MSALFEKVENGEVLSQSNGMGDESMLANDLECMVFKINARGRQ